MIGILSYYFIDLSTFIINNTSLLDIIDIMIIEIIQIVFLSTTPWRRGARSLCNLYHE